MSLTTASVSARISSSGLRNIGMGREDRCPGGGPKNVASSRGRRCPMSKPGRCRAAGWAAVRGSWPGMTPGMAACGPAWPYSSAASPSPPSVSLATAPRGSWVGLKASMMRLGVAGSCGQAGLEIDPHELDAGRSAERNWRLVGKRDLEEVADHRCGDIAAGLAMSERRRIVEADIDADHEVGREADEPGILLVVGGAGLARDRPVQHFELLRRAALR